MSKKRGRRGKYKIDEKEGCKKYSKGEGQLILLPRGEKPYGVLVHLRAAGFHINLSCLDHKGIH